MVQRRIKYIFRSFQYINQDESVETPWFVIIKSPINMVNEYQEEGYAKVQFNANTKTTTITESE